MSLLKKVSRLLILLLIPVFCFAEDTGNKVKIIKPGQSYYDLRYLKLDQTTPQSVTGGAPILVEGIAIGDGTKTLKKIDASTVGLYVNGELLMSWNNSPNTGEYMGFSCITYS